MYFLYSLWVVAQIILIFHLHIAGFNMFDASRVHSQEPAQIIVCISSINSITSFSTFDASSITCFILSSNSHLYFAHATILDISSDNIFLSFIENGTFHVATAKASHSAIAVLPTPGSQTRTGLFFVFLFNIAINLSISSSLHSILSIFHSLASFVKSLEKKSNAGVVVSSFLSQDLLFSNGSTTFAPENKFLLNTHNNQSIISHHLSHWVVCFVSDHLNQSIVQVLFISSICFFRSVGIIPI
jgi:hypothetical protein